MAKKNIGIFNTTDNHFASQDRYTDEEADKFIKEFPLRYEKQRYYRTAMGEKINPKDVVLTKVPFN